MLPQIINFITFQQGLLAMIFILAGDIAELIDFASFLIWTFYALAMVALLVLRRVKKDVERPFKVFNILYFILINLEACTVYNCCYLGFYTSIQNPVIFTFERC